MLCESKTFSQKQMPRRILNHFIISLTRLHKLHLVIFVADQKYIGMTVYGISVLAVIPIRALPSDKAEMVSQLLFGETYKVLDSKGKWCLIQTDYDGYEGWIDAAQHAQINETAWTSYNKATHYFLSIPVKEIKTNENEALAMGFGSTFCEEINTIFPKLGLNFPSDDLIKHPTDFDADKMTAYAKLWLGSTYLWGGKSVFGVDCSGFTQLCAKLAGYQLLRDARLQATQGHIVDFLQETHAGDLAFFDNEEGNITHVGIVLDNQKIIHASGKVRIDNIDHQGIYNTELQKYTHKLRFFRRLQ